MFCNLFAECKNAIKKSFFCATYDYEQTILFAEQIKYQFAYAETSFHFRCIHTGENEILQM